MKFTCLFILQFFLLNHMYSKIDSHPLNSYEGHIWLLLTILTLTPPLPSNFYEGYFYEHEYYWLIIIFLNLYTSCVKVTANRILWYGCILLLIWFLFYLLIYFNCTYFNIFFSFYYMYFKIVWFFFQLFTPRWQPQRSLLDDTCLH